MENSENKSVNIENKKDSEPAPKYDEEYLNGLIQKASGTWKDIIDADEWVRNLRGKFPVE